MKNVSGSYGIGGNEVQIDAGEAISEIPQNKTLIAQKLTPNTPIKPEVITGLTTIDDVFEHFSPSLKVNLENEDQGMTNETLEFKNLSDFTIKGLVAQSNTLLDLETKSSQYQKMIKQLKTNKVLKLAVQDPEAKQALIDVLEILQDELSGK